MTIDEAIKELQNWNSQTFETHFVTFSKAQQLGIEALKVIKGSRRVGSVIISPLLPGETE